MRINWLQITEGPAGIPVPTYGEYGGPNWTGGQVVGDDEPGDYTVPPEDPLDALFRKHDMAYDQPNTFRRAVADRILIEKILKQPEDAVTGEGDLYAGGAVFAMLYQIIVVNDRPEVLIGLDIRKVMQGAIDRIEQGSINPEPQEVAGFLTWLNGIGEALAASDNPIANEAADAVRELAATLGSAPPAEFQDILTDAAIDFVRDVAPRLEDAIDDIVHPRYQPIVEKILHKVPDWLDDVTPDPVPAVVIDKLTDKLGWAIQKDFWI